MPEGNSEIDILPHAQQRAKARREHLKKSLVLIHRKGREEDEFKKGLLDEAIREHERAIERIATAEKDTKYIVPSDESSRQNISSDIVTGKSGGENHPPSEMLRPLKPGDISPGSIQEN